MRVYCCTFNYYQILFLHHLEYFDDLASCFVVHKYFWCSPCCCFGFYNIFWTENCIWVVVSFIFDLNQDLSISVLFWSFGEHDDFGCLTLFNNYLFLSLFLFLLYFTYYYYITMPILLLLLLYIYLMCSSRFMYTAKFP